MVQRDRRRFGQEAVEYDSTQDALKGASKMVGQMGQQALHKEKALADADAANRINAADREAMTFTEDHKIKWSKDPRNKEAHSEYTSGLREIYERNREGIDPVGLSTYNGFSTGRQQKGNLSSTSWEIDQNEKNIYTAVESNVETNLDRSYEYGRSGDLQGALQAYRDSNETLAVTGQNLDPQQQSKLLKGYESDSMAKFLDGTIESNPYQTMEYLKNEQVTTSLGSGEAVDEVRSKAEKKIKAMDSAEAALKKKGGKYTKEQLNEIANKRTEFDANYADMNIKKDKNGKFTVGNNDRNTMSDLVGIINDTEGMIKVGGISEEKGRGRLQNANAALMNRVRKEKAEGISMWSSSADEYMVGSLDTLFPKMTDYDKGMVFKNMYNEMEQRGMDPRSDTTEARRMADDILRDNVKDYMKQKHPSAISNEANMIIDDYEKGNKALGEVISIYDNKADPMVGSAFNEGGYEVEEINGRFYNVLRSPAGEIVDKNEVL